MAGRLAGRDKRAGLWYFRALLALEWDGRLKKQWLYFLLAFAVPLVSIFWWVGGFAEVRVEPDQTRGPYHFAYLDHSGDYAKLPERQLEALRALQAQGIAQGAAVTLMQNDPRSTARDKLAAQTGYLVAADVRVREPLKLADVAARRVVVAQVRAHPRLAAGKVYAALLRYLDEHGMKLKLPTLEIYQNNELSVEMDI